MKVVFASVVRYWRQVISAGGGECIVFSPFVTSGLAEELLKAAGPDAALFTRFDAELFVTGASSLAPLRRLIDLGVRVFHVDGLHAKVVWSPRGMVVGSQNLTRGGTKNLEANAVVADQGVVRRARSSFAKWIENAALISLDMIDDMERKVRSLRGKYRSIRHESTAATTDVFALEARRKTEQAARSHESVIAFLNVRGRRTPFEIRVMENVRALKRAERSMPIAVRLDGNGPVFTLKCRNPNDSMAKWAIGGALVTLSLRSRYLVLFQPVGRLGWATLNKGRLTYFETDAAFRQPIGVDGVDFYMSVECCEPGGPEEPNLRLSFGDRFDVELIRVDASFRGELVFDVGSLQVMPSVGWAASRLLVEKIRRGSEGLKRSIAARLLLPFEYPRKHTGLQADQFVGEGSFFGGLALGRAPEGLFLVLSGELREDDVSLVIRQTQMLRGQKK